MSDFSIAEVSEAYKCLLHTDNANICNVGIYTGKGIRIPINIIHPDVVELSGFNTNNISTIQPYKGYVHGALSATSLMLQTTASVTCKGNIVNRNNSIINQKKSFQTFCFDLINSNNTGILYSLPVSNSVQLTANNVLQIANRTTIPTCYAYNTNSMFSGAFDSTNCRICSNINSVALGCNNFNSLHNNVLTQGLTSSVLGCAPAYRSYYGKCNSVDSFQTAEASTRSVYLDGQPGIGRSINCVLVDSATLFSASTHPISGSFMRACAVSVTPTLTGIHSMALSLGLPVTGAFLNSTTLGYGSVNSSINSALIDPNTNGSYINSITYVGSVGNSLRNNYKDVAFILHSCSTVQPQISSDHTYFGRKSVITPRESIFTLNNISSYILAGSNSVTDGDIIVKGNNSRHRTSNGRGHCITNFDNSPNSNIFNTSCSLQSWTVNTCLMPNSFILDGSCTNCGRNNASIYACNQLNSANSLAVNNTTSLSANTTTGNYITIKDIPTSPTGLPCGHLWVDPATRNLRIVMS